MNSKDIREKFLEYFEDNGHRRVLSSSLVPKNDPTLMFANAGMNQFKNIFLGLESVENPRATSCQKCCRVSGKHNDFEMVGKTPRHHTFFEMLGNFSFGDYFKMEAIEFAYDLFVNIYKIPIDNLFFTVFRDDDEAFDIWKNHIGIPEKKIFRFDEKENFWAMGETGPCGPCSEIHYDYGLDYSCGKPDCNPSCECGRFVELWNLVFMQFNRKEDGTLDPLAKPSVDTGAGLERIAAVLQGKDNNYHSDLFMPLIDHLSDRAGIEYDPKSDSGVAFRVIADHVRASSFLIADGVLPSNEGRGYVLRRIIRRGIRFARKLQINDPFLYESTGFVVSRMKDLYPELLQSRELIARVVLAEEERFNSTVSIGLNYYEELIRQPSIKKSRMIPGKEIFKLYDTFGLPLDFTRDLAGEAGFGLDEKGFEAEMKMQKERARKAWKGAGGEGVEELYLRISGKNEVRFTGYDETETTDATVISIIINGAITESIEQGTEGEVVLNITPFYGETGGQVGDIGYIKSGEAGLEVIDAFRPTDKLIVHKVKALNGKLQIGDKVTASVDIERRRSTMRNHTATHLLQASLRNELGNHVKQAGSLVTPERLRFDFTHFSQVGQRELIRIERFVNSAILDNRSVTARILPFSAAIEEGAIALFDEKYADEVRLISVEGISRELCGGTHVSRTGDIGPFKIISEGSISAGVRRIEAFTGWNTLEYMDKSLEILDNLKAVTRTTTNNLGESVEGLIEKNKSYEKEIKELHLKLAEGQDSEKGFEEIQKIADINLYIKRLDHLDASGLRDFSDRLKNRYGSIIIVLGSTKDGKALLLTRISDDLLDKIDAVSLIKKISIKIGGGGGGRADMAQAGGKIVNGLDSALEEAGKIVSQMFRT